MVNNDCHLQHCSSFAASAVLCCWARLEKPEKLGMSARAPYVYICPLTEEEQKVRAAKRAATLQRLRESPEYQTVLIMKEGLERGLDVPSSAPSTPRDWPNCSKRCWEKHFKLYKDRIKEWYAHYHRTE